MPDLAMCRNESCPSKLKCFRYMAIPDPYWQPFAQFEIPPGHNKCECFMEIGKGARLNQSIHQDRSQIDLTQDQ